MTVAKTKFNSELEKQEYVRACDSSFEARLDEVVKQICETAELRYLTLSGPTCSGKTTASKKLVSEFYERGKKVKIISLDDFFRSRAELQREAEAEGRAVDFDSERALDLPRLSAFISEIKQGRPAPIPRFDFTLGKAVNSEVFHPGDADILIFEGIQAIYPVFTDMIKGMKCLSLIINVEDSLEINGKTVSPRTVRLMRRLVRDFRFRGAEPDFSFVLWESVVKNEDKNILPFTAYADLHINSLLGYEPCMLKPYLAPLMESISPSSPYYGRAQELLALLADIDTVSSDYIPENGLYKEFI